MAVSLETKADEGYKSKTNLLSFDLYGTNIIVKYFFNRFVKSRLLISKCRFFLHILKFYESCHTDTTKAKISLFIICKLNIG